MDDPEHSPVTSGASSHAGEAVPPTAPSPTAEEPHSTPADVMDDRSAAEHQFLDLARVYDWMGLADALRWGPTLVNAHPCGRWSALHQAARAGEKSVVEWLLGAGADATITNGMGHAPHDLTANQDMCDLLMSAVEGRFHPTVPPPPAPTAVGGYLPQLEGGNL